MVKFLKRQNSSKIMLFFVITLFIGFIALNGKPSIAASSYPYLIKVNKQQNCVTVYEQDSKGKYTKPVKAMVCSTGYATPLGTYRTPGKYRWWLLMGDVWGQYCTRINKGVLFHSVWYYEKDPSTVSGKQYNNLGTTCSHGCVRLAVADAKWIYNNCPIGTTVVVYNSSDPGPLGKPTAIKVPNKKGWDPTDTGYSNNPYNKKKPSISGAKNQTIAYGSAIKLMRGVTAKNSTGFNATSQVKLTIKWNGKTVSKLDTKQSGKYTVTYTITDELNRTATKTVIFVVKEDTSVPVLTGVEDMVIKSGVTVDHAFAVKNVTAKQGDKAIAKNKIRTKITMKNEALYVVEYSVTGTNGKITTAKATITIDAEAPVFSGIENREIAWDTAVNEEFALKGVTVTDNISKLTAKNIKVQITQNNDNTYTVVYTAADAVGNKATQEATFTITNFLKIEGAKDLTVPANAVVNSTYALTQGVKAYDGTKDITSSMTVSVSDKVDNKYTVTFTVSDAAGHKKEVKVIYTVEPEAPATTSPTA
jgi:Uncharacterized protein conserved in bacteria